MKKTQIILLMFASFKMFAQNDTSSLPVRNCISIEVDPAPFILGGYSFSVKYSPKKATHFTLMGSVYSSPFPDKMMSRENYANGFRNQKMETSCAVFIDYFKRSDRRGLHFGPSAFLYSRSVGVKSSTERTNFESVYPNLRIGYVYKPFRKVNFYVDPWFNFGKEFIIGSNDHIGDTKYKASSFYYVLAVHLGYQITF